VAAAIASVLLGILALLAVVWFPTLAILLGLVALAVGLLSRRRNAARQGGLSGERPWRIRLGVLGIGTGAAAVVASIVVVILSTA
jgi:hypothetical protein